MVNLKMKCNYKTCKFIAVMLAVAFIILQPAASAALNLRTDYTDKYNSVLDYLENGAAPTFGSINGEWKVFALARSGRIDACDDYSNSYYEGIEEMVRQNGSGVLHPRKSTENSRLIIALSGIGRDSRDVAGYDLVEPLRDFDYVKMQGINGAIFALIALDSNEEYNYSSIKNLCVDYILNKELSGGGFALSGNSADPDITAMAIYALSGYSRAASAVERGVNKLSEMQSEDGGYSSWGTLTSESCSQVIVALSTLGIDADHDERFIKSGTSVLEALCSFYTDGGFEHVKGGGINAMASEQAAYALCAYDRYKNGENTLFDMSDVVAFGSETPEPIITPTVTPKPTARPTAGATPSNQATPEPSIEVSSTTSVNPNTDESDASSTPSESDSIYETIEPVSSAVPEDSSALNELPEGESTLAPNNAAGNEEPKGDSISLWLVIGGVGLIAAAVTVYFVKWRKE